MEVNLETIQGQLQEIELTSPKIVNANWGKIEGDITQLEDLQNILTLKANTSDLLHLSIPEELANELNNKVDKELGKSLILADVIPQIYDTIEKAIKIDTLEYENIIDREYILKLKIQLDNLNSRVNELSNRIGVSQTVNMPALEYNS